MSMNGDKIRKLEDLTDSRLLYEKDIPKFGYMLIILTSFLMFCVVIWSITAHKPYIVKADGILEWLCYCEKEILVLVDILSRYLNARININK